MDPAVIAVCTIMCLAGCLLGLFSGIVPGIHVNTLSSLLLVAYPSLQAILSDYSDPEWTAISVACCVMSASIVHSFVDFVPSVFIGAPDDADAVAVLPGHRLLLEGEGMRAVRAAASGSMVGASCAIILAVPLQRIMLTSIGENVDGLSQAVALIATCVIILGSGKGRSIQWCAVSFTVSGIWGMILGDLDIGFDGMLGEGTVMFPLLSGLFGIPMLLSSSKRASIPDQRDSGKDPTGMVPGIRGVLMGCLAGWFPGITSTVGASMSACVFKERSSEEFIANVASIGTVTSILSVVALTVSGSGRSGTAIVLRELCGESLYGFASTCFLVLMVASALASLIGFYLTIWSGKMMSRAVSGIDARKVNICVLFLTTSLVLLLTGPGGLIVLAISTVIGFIPQSFGISRITLCGCLVMPVLLG